tara:strand:+ start:461 stop:601 length:141 start_codon:yes stop_codon:yes gene_type:complete
MGYKNNIDEIIAIGSDHWKGLLGKKNWEDLALEAGKNGHALYHWRF